MKEVTITIKTTLNAKGEIDEHEITGYVDPRFPGLAIHPAWDFFLDDWAVTHIRSGMQVAKLPTRAAATAALQLIGRLQNWDGPQEEVAALGEPREARWLRTSVYGIVERIKSDRQAALSAAGETGAIDAASLEAALEKCRCDKMRRVWRSRSPVTQNKWAGPAADLSKATATSEEKSKLAAALYAAASDFSPGGKFRPAALNVQEWKQLAKRVREYLTDPPEKALSRGQYEAKRRAARKLCRKG
jgi:hypothetical protein